MQILPRQSFLMVIAGTVLALMACAPPFPSELLDEVDSTMTADELWKDPERVRGRVVMIGGMILETRNRSDGTVIEILHRPLDREGRPERTDETRGRFLVATSEFLDAAVYQQGRTMTVIGRVEGSRVRKLGAMDYGYPLIAAKALHLWSPSAGPRFSIGIGVYRGF